MKHLLREYGFLTILVLAGIGAYFVYQNQATDLVDASLDSIGSRLQEMLDEPQDQAYASDLFESFRDKVHRGDISPTEFERVAANILNLSRSGSSLTPQEASLLLDVAALNPDSMALFLGLTRAGAKTQAGDQSESWDDVGQNVIAAFAFDKALAKTLEDSALRTKFWFDSQNGLKLVLEDTLQRAIQEHRMQAFANEVEKLERRHQLVWLQHTRPTAHREDETVVERDATTPSLPGKTIPNLEVLTQLRSLRAKGYAPPADIDSLLDALEIDVDKMVKAALDSAGTALGRTSRKPMTDGS